MPEFWNIFSIEFSDGADKEDVRLPYPLLQKTHVRFLYQSLSFILFINEGRTEFPKF